MLTLKICFIFRTSPPFSVTVICDSMAKHVHKILHTTMQCFRGANITKIQKLIEDGEASIDYKYTILHVGTNNIPSSLKVEEIMSLYQNLITFIRSRSYTRLVISAIIPRPCDSYSTKAIKRCKSVNEELEKVCRSRNVQFLKTLRIFLKAGKPICSLFAINDEGLRLNLEGSLRLRQFFINTVSHL